MREFKWIGYNRDKIGLHALSPEEVEFAWHRRLDVGGGDHPVHGPYTESDGFCPSGKLIRIVWRYDVGWDGEEKVYIITAF